MNALRWYLVPLGWALRHAVTPHRVGCALFLALVVAAYVTAWRVDRWVFELGGVALAAFACGYGLATARRHNRDGDKR